MTLKRYYTTALDGRTFEHPDGPFVLYAEHEARVEELEDALRSCRAWLRNPGNHDNLYKIIEIALAQEEK